ncbi:DNA-binding response OmpR family regulator [Brevundimonas alba]|uniref:DNA-binding response OmpR family regulator n=1 Tax=Brevundimonas alba TaxID=74314 RepID=A0A7X6BPE4_9CAUL|nr:response regulator [Brevundimonas alba]NJC41690.1 DNA-binding response OmpR family regulator [Brevundimonas alba]
MSNRVLIVEDDAMLREAMDLILTQAGYQVLTAATGAGVTALATRFEPHLVLLDVSLPDTSGVEVLRNLRRWNVRVPVVMVTANRTPEIVRDVMASGGNGYLLKPFEPKDLIDRVRRALSPSSPRTGG